MKKLILPILAAPCLGCDFTNEYAPGEQKALPLGLFKTESRVRIYFRSFSSYTFSNDTVYLTNNHGIMTTTSRARNASISTMNTTGIPPSK